MTFIFTKKTLIARIDDTIEVYQHRLDEHMDALKYFQKSHNYSMCIQMAAVIAATKIFIRELKDLKCPL